MTTSTYAEFNEVCPFRQAAEFDRIYNAMHAAISEILESTEASKWDAARGQVIIVSPSAKQPGKTQLTFFSSNGLSTGDAQFSSCETAEIAARLIQYEAVIDNAI